MSENRAAPAILEMRLALTTADFERAATFYSKGLNLEPEVFWDNDQGQSLVLDLGRATFELFDEQQATTVDVIETGRRSSGEIRLALRVPDLDRALATALAHGGALVSDPVVTPWGDRNVRILDPDGLHITLFEASEGSAP